MSTQIKSRKRVADFTAKKQVDDMLSLIPNDILPESVKFS